MKKIMEISRLEWGCALGRVVALMAAVEIDRALLVRASWFSNVKPDSGLEMLPGHLLKRCMAADNTRLLPPCSVSIFHLKRSKSHKDSWSGEMCWPLELQALAHFK